MSRLGSGQTRALLPHGPRRSCSCCRPPPRLSHSIFLGRGARLPRPPGLLLSAAGRASRTKPSVTPAPPHSEGKHGEMGGRRGKGEHRKPGSRRAASRTHSKAGCQAGSGVQGGPAGWGWLCLGCGGVSRAGAPSVLVGRCMRVGPGWTVRRQRLLISTGQGAGVQGCESLQRRAMGDPERLPPPPSLKILDSVLWASWALKPL